MRLATYNVENLFSRAKALNLPTWKEGKPILEKFAKLNSLLGEASYTPTRRKKIAQLMIELGLEKSDKGQFVILRRNRGSLLKRPAGGGIEIVAEGRTDWVGSLDLIQAPVDEEAMRNTARVLMGVDADILAVIEAENRPALADFNTEIVGGLGGVPYRHVMLIDGNDSRGIDVGILSRAGFPIGMMQSHVDDMADGKTVFSRDCPEFHISLPSGEQLLVLVNHLKSKGYGGQAESNAKRRLQAEQVRAIYEARIAQGIRHIAIVGDFNDTPGSNPLAPLMAGTDLRDVFQHPNFDDGGYPGTFGGCTASSKFDYILLSPDLFERVQSGGVFRKGMWPGVRPVKWETFAELARPEDAGSDHGMVWVDIDI